MGAPPLREGGVWGWLRSMGGVSVSDGVIYATACAYSCLHGCIDNALPAAYKALEGQLALSPSSLGLASSLSRVAHALLCPLWGVLIDSTDAAAILAVSTAVWGVSTALLAAIHSAYHLVPLSILSGASMAAMGPLTQKLIADAVASYSLGAAFGVMSFFQSFGRFVALMAVTSCAQVQLAGSMGWRWAFLIMGMMSLGLSLFSKKYLMGAPRGTPRGAPGGPPRGPSLSSVISVSRISVWCRSLKDLHNVFNNKSFWLMLIMGISNGIPRSALGFMTMWLQYCGLGAMGASSVVSISLVSAMMLSPFVGRATDRIHKAYPQQGRALTAQTALILRCILMWILLRCIDRSAESLRVFLLVSCLIGLLAGWPGVAVNRPILTEIVPSNGRATVFSLVSTTEAVGAALLGAPLVGLLAEGVFGYIPPKRRSNYVRESVSTSSEEGGDRGDWTELDNAEALSKALLLTTVIPWLFSVFLYLLLMKTYKVDRQRALRQQQQQQQQQLSSSSSSTAASAAATEDREEDSDIELCELRGPQSKGGGPYYIKVASSVQTVEEEETECIALQIDATQGGGNVAAAAAATAAAAGAAAADAADSDSSPAAAAELLPRPPAAAPAAAASAKEQAIRRT